MEKEIVVRHGKGDISMQDDYMDFINYVFGFNGTTSDFYKLLPKLYKPEFNPAASSYVTLENDKIKAVVGAYDIELETEDGDKLLCRGLGNVAVHPFSRSKGYMRKLMEMSIEDMIADGVDFSALGGRRQRYNYFSYERGGKTHIFSFNEDNMRHTFGKVREHRFEIKKVCANDNAALDAIADLCSKLPLRAIRERAKLFDILSSWAAKVYAAYNGDEFVGYAVIKNKDSVTEILTVNDEDLAHMLVCLYDAVKKEGNLSVSIPPFLTKNLETLFSFCERVTLHTNEMYSVFNYKKVCAALLKLKAKYDVLPDGEVVIEIDGRAKKERLLFKVENGNTLVEDTDREPDAYLSHLEAENIIFAHISFARRRMPAVAQNWFPLPLWVFSADMV